MTGNPLLPTSWMHRDVSTEGPAVLPDELLPQPNSKAIPLNAPMSAGLDTGALWHESRAIAPVGCSFLADGSTKYPP